MKSSLCGHLSKVLCSATKTTGNITKGVKENKEISKKETFSLHGVNSVSDLAYSVRACVEQLHLFLTNTGSSFTNVLNFVLLRLGSILSCVSICLSLTQYFWVVRILFVTKEPMQNFGTLGQPLWGF
jgi:hypothetical protein